ncbi:alpha/beta hydrolase [Streptomyces fradiae]|uniref:Carboxylesterase A n=1 Tax=Streptomyces rubrolavendulae TaxID=285473 RepID=A0A1D8G9S0_9ACTN|nr:alpha/beta hydrolase [Streptomyces rubrolavendulae]AOT62205.1 Carboxylesterase A precursor [Streptomyces rubrolavendulae]
MITPGPRRHRRAIAAATAALLASIPLSGCGPGDRQQRDDAVPAALRPFYEQELRWEPCGEQQCATLDVPMDYTAPGNGRTFTLPLIRATAGNRDRRIGSLVFNPGGPGESGVAMLRDGGIETFSERLRERFDIVGFDPRGVGGSRPAIDCGADDEAEPTGEADEADSGPHTLHPATARQRAAALTAAEQTAAACREHSGAILPHVGTTDAARDMDVLRAALGDAGLSYLGWSYGTSLGTAYGELFPRKVRAMVLDGAIDPSLTWSQRALSQARGFREAVDDYAEHCSDVVGEACPAGTPEAVRGLLKRLYEATADRPLPVEDSEWGLDTATLHSAVTTSMYTPEEQWEPLSLALGEADRGDGTRLAAIAAGEPPAEDEQNAEEESPATDDETVDSTGDADSALTAVNCVDIPHPKDPREYWEALDEAHRAEGDHGSDAVVAALGCKGWPQAGPGPHRVRADGLPPVLVVGTTGDPSTPYHEAQSLARQLPHGMLLTYEGLGHTAYGRAGACVDTAVDAYLVDLTPVEPGKTC